MKEQKRRQRLSGAVLIMVLTVMVVLIIMLMATLTVVTTANQRIYTKFEENQAYYTARSALDVFTQNMLIDKNYYSDGQNAADSSLKKGSYEAYLNGNDDKDHEMTQGLALQLDMYSLYCVDGENVSQDALKTYASDPTHGHGTADAKDEYINYFGTKIDPTGGPAESTKLVYEVWLPQVSGQSAGGTSGDYGKLSDGGLNTAAPASAVAGGGKATITVEVIERKYDLGTYTDGATAKEVTDANRAAFFDPANYNTNKDKIAEAVFNGNRKKDVMRVKITATAEFEGNQGTAVIYYDTREGNTVNSSNAITAFGGGGADNMSILGGLSMGGTSKPTNDGVIYGNSYVEGAYLSESNGQEFHITDGESVYVKDGLYIWNAGGGHTAFIGYGLSGSPDSKPFVYVGGDAAKADGSETYAGYSVAIGNMNNGTTYFKDVDLITEKGIKVLQDQFSWKGDIYCNGDFNLNACGNVNIEGNLYVNGDIIFKSGCAGFQVQDGETLTFDFSHVTGNVYCSRGVYNDEAKSNNLLVGVSPGTTGNLTPVTTGSQFTLPPAEDINDPTKNLNGIKITLPGTSGTINKTLRTHVDNFADHYQKDATTGALVLDTTTHKPIPIDAVTYSEVQFTDPAFINGVSELNVSNINTAATERYYLGDTNSAKDITISGGGRVELVLTGTSYEQLTVLVDNDPTLSGVPDKTEFVLYFANSGACKFNNGLQIYTSATKAAIGTSASKTLHVGDHVADPHKPIFVPPINIYSVASSIEICNRFFLTGYFYGPTTEIISTVNGDGIDANHLTYNSNAINYYDNSSDNLKNRKFNMIGSVLCAKFNMPNNPGIAYINPDLDAAGTPGLPIHNWTAYRYARN